MKELVQKQNKCKFQHMIHQNVQKNMENVKILSKIENFSKVRKKINKNE
jgi:hypothetical protein